jgi:hypothetical protein
MHCCGSHVLRANLERKQLQKFVHKRNDQLRDAADGRPIEATWHSEPAFLPEQLGNTVQSSEAAQLVLCRNFVKSRV